MKFGLNSFRVFARQTLKVLHLNVTVNVNVNVDLYNASSLKKITPPMRSMC